MESSTMTTESEVRERILEVAQASFMKNGYVGTKTRQIAKGAGTSETSVFRHFDSKYSILTAVYDRSWRKLIDYIDVRLRPTDHDDPRDELFNVIEAFWSFYDEDPVTCAFLIINTGNTDSLLVDKQEEATISDGNIAYICRIESLCRAAWERGLLGDLTPRAMAEGLFGLSEGVLLGWYLHDRSAEGRYPEKISTGDALRMLKKLLY